MNIKLCTIDDVVHRTYFFEYRYEVFSKRLNWNVPVHNGKEYDQYDTKNARYIIIFDNHEIIASVRMIETKYPHLFTGSFHDFFSCKNNAPIEATRFFVRKHSNYNGVPICQILFSAMIEYCLRKGYSSILAIVGAGMDKLLNKYGWKHSIVEKCIIESKPTYLINLPISSRICNLIKEKASLDSSKKILSIYQEDRKSQL
jgi:N-acyl-L-homoserine lactone synthetase